MIISVLLLCNQTYAEVYCVENSSEFRAALLDAQGNGESDEIRLKIGDYLTAGNEFFFNGRVEAHGIKISGNWINFMGGDCVRQVLGQNTVLDGGDQDRILNIISDIDVDVTVSDLIFLSGLSISTNNDRGAALRIGGAVGFTGEVLVERNQFIGNEAKFSVILVGDGEVVSIRNNFIFANHTEGNAVVELVNSNATGVYFTNNTVIENTSDGDFAGVRIFTSGTSEVQVINNVLWNNELRDLTVTSQENYSLLNNIIGVSVGIPDWSLNNSSESPEFQSGLFNYTPAIGGNLFNRGYNIIGGTSLMNYGPFDELGHTRIIHSTVDIGAYEAREEPLFFNSFE